MAEKSIIDKVHEFTDEELIQRDLEFGKELLRELLEFRVTVTDRQGFIYPAVNANVITKVFKNHNITLD